MANRNRLSFSVWCRSTYPFFEKIAAFNVQQAANAYAQECSQTNPTFVYKVRNAGNKRLGRPYGGE